MSFGTGHAVLGTALLAAAVAAAGAGLSPRADEVPSSLESAPVVSGGASDSASFDGVVQAVRQTVMAAQVAGAVASLDVQLLVVYDPAALRVSAAVPQTSAARLKPGQPPQVELPGVAAGRIVPVRVQLLPVVDPATHTLELRLDLPAGLPGVAPGMFARAWLPADAADTRLYVPAQAVVRRTEVTAVYVLRADGRPLLRQVRLGRTDAGRVEVLAGVSAGERIALDPQAAARVR
jgi:hypothetical protein